MKKGFLFGFLILSVLGFSQDNFPGNALNFHGDNDFVEIPDDATLDLVNNYTLEVWVMFNDFDPNMGIISKYQSYGANGYYLRLGSTSPYTGLSFDGLETANGILQLYQWYHIVAVNNNGNRKLYINGEEQTLSGIAENIVANNNSLCFGVDYLLNPRWFCGRMDEVRIWNIPLNASQIRENMHLVLDGTESGLVSYWQFNESAGTTLGDIVGSNDGTLQNMTDYDWVSSVIPFGGGANDIQVETNGNVIFNGTNFSINYTSQNGAIVSVSRIDTVPNKFPNGMDTVFHNQYWAVSRYGTGTFSGEITFEISEGFTNQDENFPSRVKLFNRSLTSEEAWVEIAQATSVDATNSRLTFDGISTLGQFIIAKDETALIAIDEDDMDFGGINLGDSLIMNFHINNNGEDTLIISDITASHSSFYTNITTFDIPPDGVQEVMVIFKPQEETYFQDSLIISSNAYNDINPAILLSGSCPLPDLQLLKIPCQMELVTNNFNGIDVGLHSKPCFQDINGNGLIDMFVGEETGTIYRYEQDSENSTSFSFITSDFSSLDVGSYPIPAIVDLDRDGLWDMIVGDNTGKIKHFEQDSENSLSFSLVTDNFCAIDVGAHAAPCFVNLDGDDYLDLMVGKDDGGINYYEQNSINSNGFSLFAENFKSIDVGSKATPSFTDLDGDGLLDLVIGEQGGNLNHYEQNSLYSGDFTWVNSAISAMDIGWNSAPSFNDIDNDGYSDLIIGDYFGKLRHYRQAKTDTVFVTSFEGLHQVEKYYIKASNLVDNLIVQSSGNEFLLSYSEDSGFSTSLSLSPQNGKVNDTVYVYFQTSEVGVFEGNISHISTYMDTSYVYLHSTIYPADNYPGNTLDFDQVDDYVKCEMKPEITGNHNRTIEAWAYTRSFNGGGIFQSGITGETNRDFSLRTLSTDNLWRMQFWGYDYDLTLPDSKDGWHHYCMTYDETDVKLYYDGKLMKSLSKNLDTGDGDIYFGKWRDFYFDGKIDEIRIWDIALDSIQIRENMHLNLPNSNDGLLSYWQFNEENENLLEDIVNHQYDTLFNMNNEDWVASTVVFGSGNSDTQVETNGNVSFLQTGLGINYVSQEGASVTISRIDTLPNLNPDIIDDVFDNQYWVIHRYGEGSFEAEMSFTTNKNLTTEDAYAPGRIKVFWRAENSTDSWEKLANAETIDTVSNTAVFSGLTQAGQYMLGRLTSPKVVLNKSNMDFGKVNIQDSLTLNFTISNIGFDTLIVSDILTSNPAFYANFTALQILPGEEQVVGLTYRPQTNTICEDTLFLTTNAINGSQWIITISGEGIAASITCTSDKFEVDMISDNFSNLTVNNRTKPVFKDIDGDGLLDMLIGDNSNKIKHYEQDSINSDSFSLITNQFLTVAGDQLCPTFTDLDGDSLLDLFIGKGNGTIDYFEQESVHSNSFILLMENFNSIDVGEWASPTFGDLDGDGLLDLLIGKYSENANINHYEQDGIHSTSFSFITDNFSNLSEMSTSAPVLTDINQDGLLDLFITKTNSTPMTAKLSYYEQDSINTTTFSLVKDGFLGTSELLAFPSFKDIDDDDLMDMFISNFDNPHIEHFEQRKLDTLLFNTVVIDQKIIRKYDLKARNLAGKLRLQCDADNYSISLSENSGYVHTLELDPVDRRVSKSIYVRYTPINDTLNSAKIIQTSPFLDTSYIFLDRYCGDIVSHPSKALDFFGNNLYLACETNGEIIQDKPKTIEFWAYVNSFNGGGLFQSNTIVDDEEWNKWTFNLCTTENDNEWKIEYEFNSNHDKYYGNTFTLPESKDSWHHYSITYDGSRVKFYYDGELFLDKSHDLYYVNDSLFFGKRDSDYFDGKMDEIRIWNYAMDSIEVREKMHLTSSGQEDNLISYWQCNENQMGKTFDIISSHDFTLHNISNSVYVSSTIPYGKGCSDSEIEIAGNLAFGETGLNLNYSNQSGANVTISRIDTLPNAHQIADTLYHHYWVLDRYGTGNFSADMTFKIKDKLTSCDINNPQYIKLFTRENTSETDWTQIKEASSLDTLNNTVLFTGIENEGQFFVVKNRTARIAAEPIDFGNGATGDTSNTMLRVQNIGDDTLFISGASIPSTYFSVDFPSPFQLLPQEEQEIELSFMPTDTLTYYDTIYVYSNATNTTSLAVSLLGKGVRTTLFNLALPIQITKIDPAFNAIDVGSYARPCFTDLDGDKLFDLIIGKSDGTISHYEQDSLNSLSFSFVTDNFNSIDVGDLASPAFTDFNKDGILDLIVGSENHQSCSYYQQDSLHSTSFSLIDNHFLQKGYYGQILDFIDIDNDSLIDLFMGGDEGAFLHFEQDELNSSSFSKVNNLSSGWDFMAPAVADFNGDGLFDVLVGCSDRFFYLTQDSMYSDNFNLVTNHFSDIYGNAWALSPTIIDVDGDGLLDILTGNNQGKITHYKQKEVNSLFLDPITLGEHSIGRYFLLARNVCKEVSIESDASNFTISLSEDSGFVPSLSISADNQSIEDTIFVRFSTDAEGLYTANLKMFVPGQDTIFIFLSARCGSVSNYSGQALQFDGINEYVNCGEKSNITGDNARSIELWAYAESFNNGGAFQTGLTGIDRRDFSLRTTTTDNQWRMQFWGNDYDMILPESKNMWHHYCMTYDGSKAKAYYDGKLMREVYINLHTGDGKLYLGKWYNDFFDGKIDEVRIWDIALDSTQIRENMHISLTGYENGLISYWQFNEKANDATFDYVNKSTGLFSSMDSSNYVISTIPFGVGMSDSQTEANGNVSFTNTSLDINYNSQNAASITASRIDTIPNINPVDEDYEFIDKYWVIHRYGDGNFNADLTFTLQENLTVNDENNPSQIKLYIRGSTADTAWAEIAVASTVDAANNTVTFNGITGFSQFIIGREVSRLNVKIIAYLEGAMNGMLMDTTLNSNALLPLFQPFNTSPWNYTGTESVSAIPSTDIVDWVLIELRDTTDVSLATPQTILAQKAVFINKEGDIVDTDGIVNPILFENVKVQDSLYVVLWHKNHLGIISAVPLTKTNGVYNYDFSTAISQAYLSGQKLSNSKATMIGGDLNSDGTIDTNDHILWKTKAGETGYHKEDANLDSQLNNKDKNEILVPNIGSSTNVPE